MIRADHKVVKPNDEIIDVESYRGSNEIVDGWMWFDTDEDAKSYYNIKTIPGIKEVEI